jgi:hypothetical protein
MQQWTIVAKTQSVRQCRICLYDCFLNQNEEGWAVGFCVRRAHRLAELFDHGGGDDDRSIASVIKRDCDVRMENARLTLRCVTQRTGMLSELAY